MTKFLKGLMSLALLFTLTSCTKESTIKVGFSASLTGTNSQLGIDGMYGVELAVAEINSTGGIQGRDIELIIQDDNNDKNIALDVDKRFVEEGCKAIIGHMISSTMGENIDYINSQNIIMISPTVATDLLSNKDDHFFRVIPSNITQAQRIATSLIEQGVHRLAFLSTQNNASFTTIIINEITKLIDINGIEVVLTETYTSENAIDYQGITQELISSKADGVVLLSSSFESANFAQTFGLLGFRPKIFLPAWAMTYDLIQRGGKAVDNIFGVNYFDFSSQSEKYLTFKSKYNRKYGADSSFASMFSYEAMMALSEAMKKSKTLDADEIKAQLLAQSEYSGVQSSFNFDLNGDVNRKIYLVQVINGQFTRVTGE